MPKKLDLATMTAGDSPEPEISIQNCVATFNLQCSLALKKISLKENFFEFNPSKFAAATVRLKHPRTTALVFQSGNVVCTGAKRELDSLLACRQFVRLLQRHDMRVSFSGFKIQNIVASTSTHGFPLKLQELAEDWGEYTSYEPELFPGLVLRITEPRLVLLLFRSGKIVITGAKHKEQIRLTYKKVYENIIRHYLDSKTTTFSSSVYRNQVKRDKIISSEKIS